MTAEDVSVRLRLWQTVTSLFKLRRL